jgi:hypothetical protein
MVTYSLCLHFLIHKMEIFISSYFVVAHAYNPNYLGGGDWQVVVQGQPRKKVSETPHQQTSLAW